MPVENAARKTGGVISSAHRAWEIFRASLLWKVVAGLVTGLAALMAFYPPAMDYIEGRRGGQLVLHLRSEALHQDVPTYVFYAVPRNSGDAKFLVPVELLVHNSSKKSDSNVSLSIKYSGINGRFVIPKDFMRHSGARHEGDILHEVNSRGRYDYSNFRIVFMPAGDSLSFTDAAFTSIIKLDDGFPVVFSTGTGLNVKVTTYSKNDVKREWDLRYRGVKVDNDEGIEWWVQNWYGKHIAIETRRSVGFWRYLSGLLISQDLVVYGFSPDFRLLEGASIYLPKRDPDKYTGFKFNPYVWSLLFDFE